MGMALGRSLDLPADALRSPGVVAEDGVDGCVATCSPTSPALFEGRTATRTIRKRVRVSEPDDWSG